MVAVVFPGVYLRSLEPFHFYMTVVMVTSVRCALICVALIYIETCGEWLLTAACLCVGTGCSVTREDDVAVLLCCISINPASSETAQ